MPKYKCTVYKNLYYTGVVEIEADNAHDAAFMAETDHGGEHASVPWQLNATDFECMSTDVAEVEHAAAGHPVG